MGLEPQPLGSLFALQARLARQVQTNLHARWQAQGVADRAGVPTLQQLRPRLDTLTVQMLRAVYLAVPALQQDASVAQQVSLAQRLLHADGWTEQGRQELLQQLHSQRRLARPALQRIAATGLLRVGTTGDYAPFSLEANGLLAGSDIQLAQQLARSLHAEAVFVPTSWARLLDDLHQDAFDMAIGGISVTAARRAQAAFSLPYLQGGKTLIARCADAARLRDLAQIDRPGVRLIVNPGGTNQQYVQENVHRAHVALFPDNRTIFGEIESGRADVMITDDVEADWQTRRHPSLCRTNAQTLTHSRKAILLPRDTAFVAAVNAWLRPQIASGQIGSELRSYLEH